MLTNSKFLLGYILVLSRSEVSWERLASLESKYAKKLFQIRLRSRSICLIDFKANKRLWNSLVSFATLFKNAIDRNHYPFLRNVSKDFLLRMTVQRFRE